MGTAVIACCLWFHAVLCSPSVHICFVVQMFFLPLCCFYSQQGVPLWAKWSPASLHSFCMSARLGCMVCQPWLLAISPVLSQSTVDVLVQGTVCVSYYCAGGQNSLSWGVCRVNGVQHNLLVWGEGGGWWWECASPPGSTNVRFGVRIQWQRWVLPAH